MKAISTALFTLFQLSVLALPASAEPKQEYGKAVNKTRYGSRAVEKVQCCISEANILLYRSTDSDSTILPICACIESETSFKSRHMAVWFSEGIPSNRQNKTPKAMI